ncbi:MAG: alpha/beta fold hydrolase [Bryobacteraceae bacterium]|nr:alpha/beta fold hydrolase [Bryobacteraceae bacterium]
MTEIVSQDLIRGTLHHAVGGEHSRPAGGVVIGHGASSNSDAKLIVALAEAFAQAGFPALRIDLPFRQNRVKGPPHPSGGAKDREGIRAALELMKRDGKVYYAGHSYGGRMGSMVAAEDPAACSALLLLSYPLHPPGRATQLRTQHFSQILRPTLFVHGTRDPFGTPDELREALVLIPSHTELYLAHGAGHELKPVLEDPGEVVQRFGILAT